MINMKNKIKLVQCGNCKYYKKNNVYTSEGVCLKDKEYTREHRVCHKLPTDEDRRNAKII